MARMIPPFVPASCPSPGEKEIFSRLKDDPGTEDWIVLHSLDIANHLRQVEGEADFVIIVPMLGVLCLEVKACRSLRIEDGLWYYGRDPDGDVRGPFKQSSDAMHSLRQQVVRNDTGLSRVPFWSAVAFPYIEFRTTSAEWHPWQVIDSVRFSNNPISSLVAGVLRSARSHLNAQPSVRWFRMTDRYPDPQQAAAIARILRPNFEFTETSSDRRARKQTEIIRFTEEQYVALDAMADNKRVLFSGPAGTGKTVLALEAARRASELGQKVLLLCFNRLLGKWLSQHPVANNDSIQVGTFHQFLLSITGSSPPPDAGDSYWRGDLPNAALAVLLENESEHRFDTVIIDEFQDLLTSAYLDVLDLVLNDGLTSGSWMLFGDFERQVLYESDRADADALIQARLGAFARCALRVNCRNTPRVATLSHLLGKLSPNYSRVLRPDDRVDPTITYYATPSQQRKHLLNILKKLFRDSFSEQDIVILSPKADSRSVASSITETEWASRLSSYEQAGARHIPFTTIHSFKGMDAPVVVVTDIEHVRGDQFSSLFYVATTRALERLYILVHETAKSDIVESLLGGQQTKTGEP